MNFQIVALDKKQFQPWLQLNDRELRQHNARWIVADAQPGYPCRVSLQDAEVGERVLLLPYTHLDVPAPYRACGPIFIREKALQASLQVNQIPDVLRHRMLSLRAYDQQSMMKYAEVVQPDDLLMALEQQLQDPEIETVHIHNAKPGCFSCAAYRA